MSTRNRNKHILALAKDISDALYHITSRRPDILDVMRSDVKTVIEQNPSVALQDLYLEDMLSFCKGFYRVYKELHNVLSSRQKELMQSVHSITVPTL